MAGGTAVAVAVVMTLHSSHRHDIVLVVLALGVLEAVPASAHHEAIFGPQSALVLSSSRNVSAQVFTRQTGPAGERTQETTTVVSTAYAPLERPLSLSFVVPFSFLSRSAPSGAHVGLENALIAARYQFDLFNLAEALSVGEAYVTVAGGIEVPTGTLDHSFGDGATAAVVAGVASIENGRFSASAYGFVRRPGAHHNEREGANRFLGGGVGWTVHDDGLGRLVTLNVGVSHEKTFKEARNGAVVDDSGGSGVFVHPTVLIGVNDRLMLFGQTSVALTQTWRDPGSRERFRVGTGVIFGFGS
jgi:hypothetical protein